MKLKKRLKLSAMTVFFGMLLGFAVMSIGTEQAFAMEWNETDNRYEISNYADLKGFAQIVNSGNTGACAKLTADIECDDELWEPIGNLYNQYTGAFDGDGHTITALSNGECISDFQGLFGYIGSEGIVKNVGLEDISIRGSDFVGGVAGLNEGGTIANCYNTGDLGGTGNVGGVAGRNDGGTITNCYNTGSVSGSGYDVGGVAGSNTNKVTISNCYNTGAINGYDIVGGVAGLNQVSGTITNCYNTGAVSGNSYVGGVAGLNQVKGTITNCYYDKELCTVTEAIGYAALDSQIDNVKGLTTEEMTGTGALNNMVFVYGTGQTSPWMVKANDKEAGYYPHLKGFLYDTTGDPDDWPPKHAHTWDGGKVTREPAETAEGEKTFTCTVCKATKTEAIPKLPPSAPGAGPGTLAKATAGKRSLTFRWDKVEGADGYDIFFSRCNSKGRKITLKNVRTIEGNKIFSWTKKGLKKRTAYKAYVKAYVMKDGKKTYIKTSPEMHAITGGYNRKYTNAKAVTVNKTEVTLTQGKSFKVKAKVKKLKKNKRLMPKSHAPKLRYMSSDSNVATVSKSGRITATGKGTCTIVAFAHNGVSKNIKVTVE